MIGPLCHSNVRGYGNTEHGVMLVGIAPGKSELGTGKVFTGQSGALLDNFLEAAQWDRKLCYATNLTCTPNEDPTLADFMHCRPRFLEEVHQVAPKLMILLGTKVTEHLLPTRKASEQRGCFIWHDTYNCHIMPTYHPAAILYAKEAYNNIAIDLLNDLRKIPMFLDDLQTGQLQAIRDVEYTIVTTVGEAQRILDNLPVDENIPVSIDVETTNLDEDLKDAFSDNLLCFAISDGMHTWVFPTEFAPNLKWPTGPAWTYHYGIFDTQQILESAGVFLDIKHDSLLLHYCLDERSGRHKLKPITRRWCYADFYEEKVDRRKLATVGPNLEETYRYCAKDATYTQRITTRLIPLVKEEGLWDVYTNLLLPAANVFKYMQREGCNIDLDYLKQLALEWLPLYQSKAQALQAEVHSLGGPEKLDFGSYKQVGDFLYNVLKLPGRLTAKGNPSTAKDVLELLADEHPFVRDLIEVRHLEHLVTTYIFGIEDDIKRDGRIHPAPMLHGTVGGRLAYSNPPVNTIPRPYEDQSIYGSKLRRLFIPFNSDRVIVEIDQKQAEIWMAWINCQDSQMYADLKSGDFHSSSAAFIHGTTLEQVTKSQRSDAKRTTFGKFFGIGMDKLAKQTGKTRQEATQWDRRWDQRYIEYPKWVRKVWNEVVENGEVRTFTNRVRRFPFVMDESIRNQAVNYKIQSPSHDILLESIINTYWHLRNQYDTYILLDVHDAFLLDAPKDRWKYAAEFAVKELTRSHFGLHPVPAETKVGDSWAEGTEVEL